MTKGHKSRMCLGSLTPLAAVSLVCLALAAGPVPPAIDPGSVVNGASRMPSSLAGGAIARGGRFSLSGVRLGPERGVKGSEADPPVTLAGVSVHIAQGQTDTPAGMLFVSAERIEGLIPRSAPLGPAQLTVVYDGRASEPYPLTLVDSSFGFFTAETAPEALPEARRPLSAAPGETVALWGAGLGDARPEIFVGGKPAGTARRAGEESCCKGVDRIEFQIPANAPQGCYVPVQARAAGRPGNVIGIAIHPVGHACQDQVAWFHDSVLHAARAGFVVLARISLGAQASAGSDAGYQFDYAVASFGKQQSGSRPFPPLPPFGSCTVITRRINLLQILGQAWVPGNLGLDTGPSISVAGPAGIKVLRRGAHLRDVYDAPLGGEIPFGHVQRTPPYLQPGVYTVTSSGGQDIGPFTARVEAQRLIQWKNRDRLAEVRRSAGVTVEWTEARRKDAVLIAAASSDHVTGDSALCVCLAYAKDRRFTIPPVSLGNLPPAGDDTPVPGFLLLSELPLEPPVRIQAQGLDAAFATFLSADARVVRFR
ncbi:MAG: hypothetical protein ABSB88_06260 [Bryobacteraceae bacterium]